MNALPVLLIIASQGYQPIEYTVPKKILEENGIKVVTASNRPGTSIANDGAEAKIDIATDKVKATNYAGIFIIGGPGALENLDNETVYNIIKDAAKNNIPFGAICISPRILAQAGVLNGKKVTGWNGDNELPNILKKHDAIYLKEKCVVDTSNGSPIVTATDPSAAQEFGKKIVEILKRK